MTHWQHLQNAPVVEALIDFRVQRSINLKLDALKNACENMAADFPSREEIRNDSAEVIFQPGAGPSLTSTSSTPSGFRLRSVDWKWVVLFGLDGFTISRLQPYSSWDDLKAKASANWENYKAAAEPRGIVRVASRFINRIPVPLGEPLDKSFLTNFSIPAKLPQAVAGFLLRVVIPFEPEQVLAIVTQTLPENSPDCIFDLDVFSTTPAGISEAEAWARLDVIHEVKNRLFFESLTPATLETFK